MRWKKPKIGAKRVVKRFLWLPLTLEGETRWLERARIEQEYLMDLGVLGWAHSVWDRPPIPGQTAYSSLQVEVDDISRAMRECRSATKP